MQLPVRKVIASCIRQNCGVECTSFLILFLAPRCKKDLIDVQLFAHNRDLVSNLSLEFMDATTAPAAIGRHAQEFRRTPRNFVPLPIKTSLAHELRRLQRYFEDIEMYTVLSLREATVFRSSPQRSCRMENRESIPIRRFFRAFPRLISFDST